MQTILNVALPIFAIMVLGYVCGHYNILGKAATKSLNDFVFLIALPPAIFLFTARAEFSSIFNGPFISAYLLGMVPTVLLAALAARFVYGQNNHRTAYHSFISIFGNSGYMGIPIFLTAFGPEGVVPAIVAGLVAGMPAMIIIMLYFELSQKTPGSETNLRKIMTGIFVRNPVFLATLLGILASAASLELPTPINNFVELLADTAGPTALFALGLSLVGHSILGDLEQVAWLTILKLLIQPAFTIVVIVWIIPVEPFFAIAAILLAAMPLGSTAYLIAQQYGVMERVSSATVAVSTAFSVVTLTALLVFFDIS